MTPYVSPWPAFRQSIYVATAATGLSYLIALLLGWITNLNWLEVFAVFTSYACTWLCVKQKRINYPIGAISTAAYCILFFQQGLIASAVLNAYLTPSLLYGWYRWRQDSNTRPVTHVAWRWVPVYGAITIAAYLGATWLVTALGGKLAFWDVIILVGSILAQFLLDNKKIENWMIWAIVNVAAIYVYFTSGLPLAGLQYVFFLGNTVYGYIEWRKAMRRRKVDVPGEVMGDMRTTPIDNPLDYRADGSIHEGDPAWDALMEGMESDKAMIWNQRKDGTWEGKEL